MPLHIVSESYGGKMAAEFALAIAAAQAERNMEVDFRSAAEPSTHATCHPAPPSCNSMRVVSGCLS